MKNKLFALLLVLSCIIFSDKSYAAFPIKSIPPAVEKVNSVSSSKWHDNESVVMHLFRTPSRWADRIKARIPFEDFRSPNHKQGWPGIASLICGVLGLVPYFTIFFCVPAIIFGIVGLNRKYKNQGLALAGLILGGVELIIIIIAIILIAAFLSAI